MRHQSVKMPRALCVGLLGVLCVLQNVCQADDNGLCGEETEGEQTSITCSCLSRNDTMILQDLQITSNNNNSSNNRSYTLPSHTMLLSVGRCRAVHLSGPTLASILHIHTLRLHDIAELHISYNFFVQYETPLQVLKLSSAGFAHLQDSLNIHAHQLSHIFLDNITWGGELNLLLQTSETDLPEVLAITNSRIKKLGEVNLSSRYVGRLVLQNNSIESILTGAFMQDTKETLIENNCIGNLSFLSLDSATQSFTLQGNRINWLALKSLTVNTSKEIVVVNNTFFHIEQHALSWLRASYEGSSLVFSGNHLYAHEEGSLNLYSAVINKNLKIEGNTLHTETCDCSALSLLKAMTKKISAKQGKAVYERFEESSFCCDKNGNMTKLTDLCPKRSRRDHLNTGRAILIVAILLVSIIGLCILFIRSRKSKIPYKTLWMENMNEWT